MTKQVINIGTANDDGTGDPLRSAFTKTNSNFTELYDGKEPTITAGTTSQYWRGDKGWQTLDKVAAGLGNVDNTSDVNKPVSTALTTALAAKEGTITAGTTLQYWRGDKVWQTLDKVAAGLANVDNTSDVNKPVSTALTSALGAKEPTITAGTTSQYWRGDKSWQTLDKTAIGLNNVDNTSDVNKPISSALTTALATKQSLSAILTGLSGLDASVGVVEQTGATTFTKRAIGVVSSTDLLTRISGDTRFAALVHTHVIADVTGLQAALNAKTDKLLTINTQSGTSYSMILSDANAYIRMTNAAANTVVVSSNSVIAYPIGTEIAIIQAGVGQTTVVASVGVTINTSETLRIRKQFSSATLLKVATDTWDLMGDLEAA